MQKKRASKKTKKPKFEVISTAPERRSLLGLTEKEEEELKRLLREINGKSKEKTKKDQPPHTEHDPSLPPAA